MLAALCRAWGAFRQPAEDRSWQRWNVLHRVRAALDAALPRDDLWTLADYKDADASLRPHVRREIRARARYEAANNPLVDRVLKVWVGDVAGEAGPALQVQSGDTTVDRFIERAWDRWWQRSNQAERLRSAVLAEAVDGEALGVLIHRDSLVRPRQPVGLDVVLLETDRLADPTWLDANRSDYVDGVHLHPLTREAVAYDILRAHPGTEYLDKFREMFEHDQRSAREVLHAFRRTRPEQHRGLTRFAPVLPLSGLHRKYLDAEVQRNVIRAAFAFILKSTAGGDPEAGPAGGVGTDQWWQQINLPNRAGVGTVLPEQWDITQLRPDGTANELRAFHEIMAGLFAGCFAMPQGRALGVYPVASYPGVRAEMQPYHRVITTDRYQVWEPLWLTPLYEAFLRELQLAEAWQEFVAALPPEVDLDALDLHAHEWNWPERELVVDPSREEESRLKRLRMGLTDREREMDSVDLDERDRRAARMLGIDDVQVYRRMLAQAILGVPVPEPGAAAQPGAAPPGEISAEFGNLNRRQWQNNRKAIRDVLQELIAQEITEAAALQMLESLGLPEARAQALIDDARDSVVDDPELQESGADPPREAPGPGLAAAWSLTANCGTGAGGFQPGNDCGQGDGGGAGEASSGPRRVKLQADPAARQKMADLKLEPADVAGLAGASRDAEIAVSTEQNGIRAEVKHPDYDLTLAIRRGDDGKLTMTNLDVQAHPAGQGTGTKVTIQQVAHAERLGIERIDALASGSFGGEDNGYYSWPRVGYDGDIPAYIRPAPPKGETRVSQLMRNKAGRDYWLKHGSDIHVSFDVRPGSLSRKVLSRYAKQQGYPTDMASYEVDE